MELLGTNFDETLVIFQSFRWNAEALQNSFFDSAKQEGLRRTLGLDPVKIPGEAAAGAHCLVCYEATADASQLACGHRICAACWRAHLSYDVHSYSRSTSRSPQSSRSVRCTSAT